MTPVAVLAAGAGLLAAHAAVNARLLRVPTATTTTRQVSVLPSSTMRISCAYGLMLSITLSTLLASLYVGTAIRRFMAETSRNS